MTPYQKSVLSFQRHCRFLINYEYPSALGGTMEVGHHLLRRLANSDRIDDPRYIVPLTAKQHDDIHAPNPTISVKSLLYDEKGLCVGCVFDYHGKAFVWHNEEWVKAWKQLP